MADNSHDNDPLADFFKPSSGGDLFGNTPAPKKEEPAPQAPPAAPTQFEEMMKLIQDLQSRFDTLEETSRKVDVLGEAVVKLEDRVSSAPDVPTNGALALGAGTDEQLATANAIEDARKKGDDDRLAQELAEQERLAEIKRQEERDRIRARAEEARARQENHLRELEEQRNKEMALQDEIQTALQKLEAGEELSAREMQLLDMDGDGQISEEEKEEAHHIAEPVDVEVEEDEIEEEPETEAPVAEEPADEEPRVEAPVAEEPPVPANPFETPAENNTPADPFADLMGRNSTPVTPPSDPLAGSISSAEENPFAPPTNPFTPPENPFGASPAESANPFGSTPVEEPIAPANPFGGAPTSPFETAPLEPVNPFGSNEPQTPANPFGSNEPQAPVVPANPFGNDETPSVPENPFGSSTPPFSTETPAIVEPANPFGSSAPNPTPAPMPSSPFENTTQPPLPSDLMQNGSGLADEFDAVLDSATATPGSIPSVPAIREVAPVPVTSGAPVAAMDLLWKIGVRDTESEEHQRETQILDTARREADASIAAGGKKGGRKDSGRIKVIPLPWERLQRGNPLIISITSPKGGSGKSSTAMNIAAWMAYNAKVSAENKARKGEEPYVPRICVFDGDIGNGTLAPRVAGRDEPNVIGLINEIDKGNRPSNFEELQDNFLITRNELPNLSILAAPSDSDAVEDLVSEDYQTMMNLLGQYFDIIIIDTGTEMWAEYNQFWARSAHVMYVLTMPENVSLKKAMNFIRYIVRSREDRKTGQTRQPLTSFEKVNLIVMRSDADWGSNVHANVQSFFPQFPPDRIKYFHDVDREIIKANNAGQFLSLQPGGGLYLKDISAISKDAFDRFIALSR